MLFSFQFNSPDRVIIHNSDQDCKPLFFLIDPPNGGSLSECGGTTPLFSGFGGGHCPRFQLIGVVPPQKQSGVVPPHSESAVKTAIK
jgi:hypothetical protein